MEPAKEELASAIQATVFNKPLCPVYQNVNAEPASDTSIIKRNLIDQLTSPVRWTQTVMNMVRDGSKLFIECGPGKVLQGLVKKIEPAAEARSI
jgi:[acyl-carrier-protein] S-malonyltransferase